MIYDVIDNLVKYIPETYKSSVEDFLAKLDVNMSDGRYEICGDDVYASISSYNTKKIDDCSIEAHDKYCDIQFVLAGEEGISIYPRELLDVVRSDLEKDFYLFEVHEDLKVLQIRNVPGYFSLIHTNEAHRPQETTDGKCSPVKKGVIKIKESLFQ